MAMRLEKKDKKIQEPRPAALVQFDSGDRYRTQRGSAGSFRLLKHEQLRLVMIGAFSIPRYRAGFCIGARNSISTRLVAGSVISNPGVLR